MAKNGKVIGPVSGLCVLGLPPRQLRARVFGKKGVDHMPPDEERVELLYV